jgi:tetratricopeptide (TPR) repeat protein
MMKYLSVKLLVFCVLFGFITFTATDTARAQAPKAKPTPKKSAKPVATPTPPGESEDELFEKARGEAQLGDRATALKGFLEKFPDSAHKVRAQELLVSARAQEAEAKMQAGDTDGGVALFELAVKESPAPPSEQFFAGVISLIPQNLAYVGQSNAALKIARVIEEKIGSDPNKLLQLAKFYLSVESGADAQRVAEKAVATDANSAVGYEILGQSHRLDLEMEEAAAAYEKGLQTGTRLPSSIMYLADVKRALGKPDEALALYKEALEKQPENALAKSGIVMALFDAGKTSDAEAEYKSVMTAQPKNFTLAAAAAYWYAAHNNPLKAEELARQAITIEPRFVWSYIALSRALTAQRRPADAEKAMLQASQYGNFPTVNYERASAKYAVGFYEEAAADLRRSFDIKDGKLRVNLAGRIFQTGDSFIDILAKERLASIYVEKAADSAENAAKLRDLLAFHLAYNEKEANEAEILAAGETFIGAKDTMQSYRQLYVANKLLQKRIAAAKAAEIAQTAVAGLESSVTVPGATLAVLADDLIEPRATALSQGSTVEVADVPPPVLLKILRGRVEELSGWAMYQQQKPDEALVRLRRAITVLPENSIWWRTSLWKMGTVLDVTGKGEEAFAAYSKSYVSGSQDQLKWATLQGICQRLYNTTNDCEKRVAIAARTDLTAKASSNSLLKDTSKPEPAASPTPDPALVKPTPETSPTVEPAATPAPTPESTPAVEPSPKPAVDETAKLSTEQSKEAQNTSEVKPASAFAVPTKDPAGAASETGRKRTVTTTDAKPGDDKGSVVYSNSTAQVRVGTLSNESTAACQVEVSPQKIILIGNGGWGALKIDLKGEGKPEDIKVIAENPDDLALELQPGIGKDIGRVVYVVRSKSSKKGDFKLTVESPCGEKKEILVAVR